MNLGVILQLLGIIIGVILFIVGLYVSSSQNKPTVFSYISHYVGTLKQEDYFDKRKSYSAPEGGLIFNGATKKVTDGLLEASKQLKENHIQEAENIISGISKENLTPKDITNIQSVKASIKMAQGDLSGAQSIYESILSTGTKSNAVFTGLGTIQAFKTLNYKDTNPEKAISLLYESNDWYFKALAGDSRPEALVTIYFNLYENFRMLTEFFKRDEKANLEKYKNLFLQTNQDAGNPYKIKH